MFPEHWDHERITRHGFCEVLTNQKIIIQNQERIMLALTDLQTSINTLQSNVAAFVAANTGGATDAQLVALKTQVDAINAVVAPPPPPAPTA